MAFDIPHEGLIALHATDPEPSWGGGYYSDGGFRIVTRPDGTMSPDALVEAVAELCVIGTRDNALTFAEMCNTARIRRLMLQCGPASSFGRQLGAMVGVNLRDVHFLAVEEPNGTDDGHIASEILVDGSWQLIDFNTMARFFDMEGAHRLSAAEVAEIGPQNLACEEVAAYRLAPDDYVAGVFRAESFGAISMHTRNQRDAWRARIFQAVGFGVPGGIEWGLPPGREEFASTVADYPGTNGTWTVLPWDQFCAKYYPAATS